MMFVVVLLLVMVASCEAQLQRSQYDALMAVYDAIGARLLFWCFAVDLTDLRRRCTRQ
jgi:Na+/melibiose symporter-like transporter